MRGNRQALQWVVRGIGSVESIGNVHEPEVV